MRSIPTPHIPVAVVVVKMYVYLFDLARKKKIKPLRNPKLIVLIDLC